MEVFYHEIQSLCYDCPPPEALGLNFFRGCFKEFFCHPELDSGSINVNQIDRFRVKHRMTGFTLAEVFHPAGQSKKRIAFTLAEVLITLGIIGVVAALTMPSLITKYQERVTVNKLKKMYSVLNSAFNMYKSEEQTDVEIFPYTKEGAEDAFKIFKPYLNIAKDCGENGAGCFYMQNYKWLNGDDIYANYGTDSLYYKALLADGSSIAFRGGSDVSAAQLVIFYDVNGAEAPNIKGKDMFDFVVRNNNVIARGNNEIEFQDTCYNENAKGYGCSAWVIFNENLDYLHCSGLTWNGPTSCKAVKK